MASDSHSWLDRVHENPPNPCLQSNTGPSNFSHPLGPLNMAKQPSVGQYPQINSLQNQSTIHAANSVKATSDLRFKEFGKPLGAIQIVIGLMHLGLGIILSLLSVDIDVLYSGYATLSFKSGYPFWGAIGYICSGSFSILAASSPTPYLVKSTLGMNIASAICAIVGIILLLLDMTLNGRIINQNYWAKVSGQGISTMLVIFSLLELGINGKTSGFIMEMLMNKDLPVMVMLNTYAANSYIPDTSTGAIGWHSR
ncbi:membrane-spanning 4-domains subfamily A member 12 [Gracilinanus agilis]|uniref:membrane-spanning 4-domains subfamily A member 12 n=1 Tax=Gracilinanus agilis TaxID=191870 RepID=UPI001CFE2F97|nr:membrane-spanning 4-domains subfamily A member 12 [Gracilinanus agilis]